MNAPVAFARNQIATGVRSMQSGPDSQMMWVCDNVSDVGLYASEGGAPAYSYMQQGINPLNETLFPNFYTQFEDWERWRPARCIVHYAHFAPTNVQGSVCLAVNEDIITDEAAGVAGTFSKLSTLSHSVVGSVYEDLSLDCTPASWRDGEWLYNDATAETGNDLRFQYPGYVFFGSDNGTNTTDVSTGILFFELAFEVCGRRTPYEGVGLTYKAIRLAKQLKTQNERDEFIRQASLKWIESLRKTVMLRAARDAALDRADFLAPGTPKIRFYKPEDEEVKPLFSRPSTVNTFPTSAISAQVMQSNLLRK